MSGNLTISSVAGVTASDYARVHVGHHYESHVYLDESHLSANERRRLRENAILSSLVFDQMTSRERAVDDACQHTFDWAFGDELTTLERFKEVSRPNPLPVWLGQENGVFFITGKAGSGKSTFMRYLANHHQTRTSLELWAGANGSSLLIASHFFWCSGGKMQSSQGGLWRSILFQLLEQHRELIPLLFPDRLENELITVVQLRAQSWERKDLTNALEGLQVHLRRRRLVVCMFIDGLDEFQGDESMLIAEIKQLLKCPLIKLCASSRPRNLFERAFGFEGYKWQMSLHTHTVNDIAEVARVELYEDETFRHAVPNEERRQAFVRDIQTRADGVFLWAVLVVREVLRETQQGGNIDELETTLEMLPTELGGSEGLFQRIIERSDVRYRKHMARLLLLILYANTQYGKSWSLRLHNAYFILRDDDDVDFASKACLRLDDKYRKSWQQQSGTSSSKETCCCNIFVACCSGRSGLHSHGKYCSVDWEMLAKDVQRQIHKWCPDFIRVSIASIIFSHRSVADFLQIPETYRQMTALAGEDFDPGRTLCRVFFASCRLTALIGESQIFLEASLYVGITQRDFARSLLGDFERLKVVCCAHPAYAKRRSTQPHWLYTACLELMLKGSLELKGDFTIDAQQQQHAWFLALLSITGASWWYIEQELHKLPVSARQDAGALIIAIVNITRSQNRPYPVSNRSDLLRRLLSSGICPNTVYKWVEFTDNEPETGRQPELELSLWQALIHTVGAVWIDKAGLGQPSELLDYVESMLDVGRTDVQCHLPENCDSLFSAMKYQQRDGDDEAFISQWKEYGPRLQTILASRGLLTQDELKMAEQGRLIEGVVYQNPSSRSPTTAPITLPFYMRLERWARKRLP